MSGADLGLVLGALALAAFVHAITGFGFAFVAVPGLTFSLDPHAAVVVVVVVSLPLTLLSLWWDRAHVDVPDLKAISTCAFIGLPLGLLVISRIPADALTFLICTIAIVSAVATTRGWSVRVGAGALRGAGVSSGALLTSTSMNGLPLILVLRERYETQRRLRGTLSGVFLAQCLAGVPILYLGDQMDSGVLGIALLGVPAVGAGWLIGDLVSRSVSVALVRHASLVVLVAPAVAGVVNLAAHL